MNGNVALPPLKEVIAKYGLGARKSLGQHFLLDTNLTDKIARSAGPLEGKTIVEIGPGPGGLTRSILSNSPKRLHVIEKDDRCIDAIEDLKPVFPVDLAIHAKDATRVTLRDVSTKPVIIISNLPYNVGTTLLINWLEELDQVDRMVLMFQKEVAERIAAPPGTSAYGRLSVLAQWLCEVRILFTVDKRAFTPPPKVASAVIELIPREKPIADADPKALQIVTAAAFGQRRKMLRKSLRPLNINPDDVGIDPSRRAETLSIEEFCALSKLVS